MTKFYRIQEAIGPELTKFGGFAIFESLFEHISHLNPERENERPDFLYDDKFKFQRKFLKEKLRLIAAIIDKCNDSYTFLEFLTKQSVELEEILIRNVRNILKDCRTIERSYNSIDLFFRNCGIQEIKNLAILNSSIEQLVDLDNPNFIDHVESVLIDSFDRLDLSNAYSMVVIPGYLESDKVLLKWAEIVFKNKVLLITDFMDLDHAEDIIDLFKIAGHSGTNQAKSNVVMTCNYLLARRRFENWEEEENLYIPGSSALAGKIYSQPIAHILSAQVFGNIIGMEGLHFDLRAGELTFLENAGLMIMTNKTGKLTPYSTRTLYNGLNKGLKRFSLVRLFDYISKVIIDNINRTAFESWTTQTQQSLVSRIMHFLNGIQGHEMLVNDFRLVRCEKESSRDEKLHIEIGLILTGIREFKFNLEASLEYGSYDCITTYDESA